MDISSLFGGAFVTDLLCMEFVRMLWCRDNLIGIVFAANPVHPHCAPLPEFCTMHQNECNNIERIDYVLSNISKAMKLNFYSVILHFSITTS